jgi:hypothetical protein
VTYLIQALFLFLLVFVLGSGILIEAKWNIECERRWVMLACHVFL